jgi:chloride channel protein, CIC family
MVVELELSASGASSIRTLPSSVMWLLSILVGIIAGLGAVAFRDLIAFFHNLLFLGKLSVAYDANTHTPPSPWGPFVIFVPVVGALGVAFLVKNFAPEAKGHGVPEVMDAAFNRKGVIRPVVSIVKALASALSIGSGGSVGREGPIIQIGSAFGSTLGQLLRVPVWQRITLIAAGAGGGIAATFNTPVGGVLFAVEIVMHEISARTLVPVATATATATFIGRLFFGPHPSFFIPAVETTYFQVTAPLALLAYAGLGAITGLVSALFIRSIYGFEHFFERRIKGGYYVQHALGMLMVGVLIYAMLAAFGHYYVEGVGYSTIQDVLTATPYPLYLLLLLFALKLLATSLTLGSGASGGIFSPSLFLGATVGVAYALLLSHWFPSLGIAPPAFAVVGMAGVVGGATGAALAAIVMIFEMTLDYTVIVPLTLTVAVSYAVRKALISDSIYTRKLVLRGERVPGTLRADRQFAFHAADIMNPHMAVLPRARGLIGLCHLSLDGSSVVLITGDSGEVTGIVTAENAACLDRAKPASMAGEVTGSNYVVVAPEDSLPDVVAAMGSNNAEVALVASRQQPRLAAADVRGVITRRNIVDAFASDLALFRG